MRTMKFALTVGAFVLCQGLKAEVLSNSVNKNTTTALLFNGDEQPTNQQEAGEFNLLGDYRGGGDHGGGGGDPGGDWCRYHYCRPNPAPVYRDALVQIRCVSTVGKVKYCGVPGDIISARLVRQLSTVACIANRTFGVTANAVWVKRGCSGRFNVHFQY